MESDKKELLLKYYKFLTLLSGNKLDMGRLERYVESLSPQDISELYSGLIARTGLELSAISLLAISPVGAAVVLPITVSAVIADTKKLLDCIGDYDYGAEIRMEINGNRFSFAKDFPIEDYKEELYGIGQSETGGEYAVFLREGKLVVY